ncbi:MAG: hypothetical protein MJH10_19290 [Epibacterium sp.]|nr:hypothetical protein [Epibacterium sp.]NQX75628.1 hypothetical protein [Epibacterium sp.]
MAAHVAYHTPMQGIIPVVSAQPASSELVAAGNTGTAQAGRNQVATVTATADVYITFGATPSLPSSTNGHRMKNGQTRDFGNLQAGWVMRVAAV